MNNREIDALVAEHIMGGKLTPGVRFTFVNEVTGEVRLGAVNEPLYYSTDISAAWEIEKYLPYYISIHGPCERSNTWQAIFWSSESEKQVSQGESKNAAMAICLAALRAKGIEV